MNEKSSYELKLTDNNDQNIVKQIVNLINEAFDLHRDIAWYNWYYHNKCNLMPIQIVITYNDMVVSQRSFVPFHIVRQGEIKIAMQATDSATSKNHRRKGLFSKSAEYAIGLIDKSSISFVGSFAGPMSYSGYKKLGWRDCGKIPRCLSFNLVNLFINKFLEKDMNYNSFRVPLKLNGNFKIVNRFENDIFVNNNSRNWTVQKTCEYLNWRYSDSTRDYLILTFCDNSDRVKGYSVISMTDKKGMKTGCILELQSENQNKLVQKKLMKEVKKILWLNKCVLVQMWNNDFSRISLLLKGFIKLNFWGTNFIVKEFDSTLKNHKIEFSLGDTDSY